MADRPKSMELQPFFGNFNFSSIEKVVPVDDLKHPLKYVTHTSLFPIKAIPCGLIPLLSTSTRVSPGATKNFPRIGQYKYLTVYYLTV